jgi:hypothetical protein
MSYVLNFLVEILLILTHDLGYTNHACRRLQQLAQHAYKESHKICWREAKVSQIEQNSTYRKYKESAHMSLIDHSVSQPSLDISHIWTPITAEVRKLQLHPM